MLKMKLFGSFSLENEKGRVDESYLHSKKLLFLLTFLLLNRSQILPHQKIMDLFWDDDSQISEGALKNLMYRLRKALSVLGEEEYICTAHGVYYWNPDILVETDYEDFEYLVMAVKSENISLEQKKELCLQAMKCYNGNVFSKVQKEVWMLPKTELYYSFYQDVVKELCESYEEEENWKDLQVLCEEALQETPMDEDFHYWFLRSLGGQGKIELALKHYDQVNFQFYEKFGIRNPEKLYQAIALISENKGGWEKNITSVAEELNEDLAIQGAFVCNYQVFRQIYQMEARRIVRSGMAEYLALIKVFRIVNSKKNSSSDPVLQEGVALLGDLLQENLRKGDVVARYNMTQYLVLLPTCSAEDAEMVMRRIRELFQKKTGKKRIDVSYEIEEIKTVR